MDSWESTTNKKLATNLNNLHIINRNSFLSSQSLSRLVIRRPLKSRQLVRLTCEGNLNDPDFPGRLKILLSKLKILLTNGKNLMKVTKVEPWNSVRVTLNLSQDAAQQLRQLAEHGDENLREIGILSVQLDGQQVISLILPNQVTSSNNNNNETSSENSNDNVRTENVEKITDITSRQMEDAIGTSNNHCSKTEKLLFDRINGNAISTDENSDSSSIHSGSYGESNSERRSGSFTLTAVNLIGDSDNSVPEKKQPKLNSTFNDPSTSTSSSICSVEDSHSLSTVQLFHNRHNFVTNNTPVSIDLQPKSFKIHQNTSIVQQHPFVSMSTSSQTSRQFDAPTPTISTSSSLQPERTTNLTSGSTLLTSSNPVPIVSSMLQTRPQPHPKPIGLNDKLSDSSSSVVDPSKFQNNQDLIKNDSCNKLPIYQKNPSATAYQQQPSAPSMQPQLSSTDDSHVLERDNTINEIPIEQPPSMTINDQTNNSSDVLGLNIDVDDNYLESVVSETTRTDADNFQDLKDINFISIFDEINAAGITATPVTNRNNQQARVIPPLTSGNSFESTPSINSDPLLVKSDANVGCGDTNRTSKSFFMTQKPSQQSLPVTKIHPPATTVLTTNSQQSIPADNSNNNIPSVLSTQNPQSGPILNPTSSSNTSGVMFTYATSSISQPNSAMFQSSSKQHQTQPSVSSVSCSVSSPRQIYVPVRTNSSWRTQQNPSQTTTQQLSPVSNKKNQSTGTTATTSLNDDISALVSQSPTSQQQSLQQSNRYTPVTNNPNTLVRQQQNQSNVQNKPLQSNQQVSNSSTLQTNTQNVALSSPLLVNLLQSDGPSNTPLQQPISQPPFNPSAPHQIRLITSSNNHSEGGNTSVMTQLMMVRVSSAHQGTQIINPLNVVSVPSTHVSSNSVSRANDQPSQTINIANNDNNNNIPAVKPKKPRKSRKKANSNESSVDTPGQNIPSNVGVSSANTTIPISPSSNDMSARIPTSSVSTFLTIPSNSMSQTYKLSTQQSTSTNVVQQTILSSGQTACNHPIFNSKQRVPPVVMFATNSGSGADSNPTSLATSQAASMVTSPSGTFFIANVSASSLNTQTPPSSMASTATGSSGVQPSGSRKQIFLATKSNSFPVSSALSAAGFVRFSNSPSSSSPTLVSSPIKLISPQQQSSNTSTSSLTMSPNELRIGNPVQQQQPSLPSTPIKSSPSPLITSPMQQTLPNTSIITSNESNINQVSKMFNNSTSPLNSPITTMLQTSPVSVSLANVVSSVKNQSSVVKTLSTSQQQQALSHSSFKTFPVPQNSPTSLLLNKLSQPTQILSTKMSNLQPSTSNVASNKIQLKIPMNVEASSVNPATIETFVVNKQETQTPNLVRIPMGENKPIERNEISKTVGATIGFKQSLVEMLSGSGNQNRSSPEKLEVFLDDDPGSTSETRAPISPSYFLAPASAFDMDNTETDRKTPAESKPTNDSTLNADQKLDQDQKNESSSITNEANDSNDTVCSVAPPTTPVVSFSNSSTSATVTKSKSEPSSFTPTSSNIKTETSTSEPIKKNNSILVVKRDYAQDLPDHILDDGDDDQDFEFWEPAHYLSGSIGSIGKNNTTPSKIIESKTIVQHEKEPEPSDSDQKQTESQALLPKPINTQSTGENVNTYSDQLPVEKELSIKEEIKEPDTNLPNGDVSQESSNSDDIKSIVSETSEDQKSSTQSQSLNVSSGHPEVASVPSDSGILPEELPKASLSKEKPKAIAAKSRRISPPQSASENSNLKSASRSRRKTSSSSDTSHNVSASKQSSITSESISQSSNPCSELTTLITSTESNESSPGKKQVFITVKNQSHQLAANTIQLSNPSQTLSQFLNPTENAAAPTSASTNSASSHNQIRFVCIPSTTNKLLQIPTNSSGQATTLNDSSNSNLRFGSFVVVKPLMVNSTEPASCPSSSSSSTQAQFKLVPNKLPSSVVAQSSSQPLYIPTVVTTSNSQAVISVKSNTQSNQVALSDLPVAANVKSISEQLINLVDESSTISDPQSSCKNVDEEKSEKIDLQFKNETNKTVQDTISGHSIPVEQIGGDSSVETSKPKLSQDSTLSDEVEMAQPSESSVPNAICQTEPIVSNQTDPSIIKTKNDSPVPNKSISRTVHIVVPAGNSSNAASNVVFLKADNSRLTTKDQKDQISLSSRSNSPSNAIRRQIFITKQPVPYNQVSQLPPSQDPPSTIYATKSNNSLTATKTLPSILRQSKRKNDPSPSNTFQTQPVSIAIDQPTIRTLTNIESVSDCEAESDTSQLGLKSQTFHSLLPNEDNLVSENVDSKPRKRARKSKVSTLTQSVVPSTITPSPVHVNYPNIPLENEGLEKTEQSESKRAIAETSRTLRNSVPATIPPLAKPVTPVVKRGHRTNRTQLSTSTATSPAQIPLVQNESISVYTTNDEAKANEKNKKQNTPSSLNRPTRSNRIRKKIPDLTSQATNSTMISTDSDTLVTCDATLIGSTGTTNLIAKNINLSSISIADVQPAKLPSSASTFVSTPLMIQVSSDNAGGEPSLVSLLETGNANTTGNNSSNSSLLVKRSRKSLPQLSTNLRPTLRNSPVTETVSSSVTQPPPNKRRRPNKSDVSK